MKFFLKKNLLNRQNKEIAIGSTLSFFFKIAGIITTYIFTLLVTRYYGADSLGIFSICFTLLMLISMISKMGMDTAALKYIAQYNSQNNIEQVSSVYWRSWMKIFFYSLIASIIIYFISPIIAINIFKKPEIIPSLKIISWIIIPMSLHSLNQESLRAIKKIGYYSFFLTQSIYLFSLSVLIFLLKIGHYSELIVPVIAISIGIVITWMASQTVWWKCSKVVPLWSIAKIKHFISTRELSKVAISLLLANSMNFVMQWTDTLSLSYFCPVHTVGIYATSVKVANLANIPYMVVSALAAPMIAEHYTVNRWKDIKSLVDKLTKLMTCGAFLFGGILFLFRHETLSLFGPQFVTGVTALQILLLAKISQAIAGPVGLILQLTGKEKIFHRIMFTVAVTNVVLNLILVPIYGINGAASATMFSIILMNGFARIAANKHINNPLTH